MMTASNVLSRRRFLSLSGIYAGFTLLSPASVFAVCQAPKNPAPHIYSFADQDGLGPAINAPDVELQCCALHKEEHLQSLPIESEQYKTVASLLRREFSHAGIEWDNANRIEFTFQHYGVPNNSSHAEQLLDYCEQINTFLYQRLSNLFQTDIKWHLLSHGGIQNEPSREGFHGFVGRYTYYVVRAVVTNTSSDEELPYLVSAQPLDRAIHHIVTGDTNQPKFGTVYIIPGTTSLVSPISELLHMTLHAPSQRYAEELKQYLPASEAKQLARAAGETVNEAAAALLAYEFMYEQHCTTRLPSIELLTKSMSTQYPGIPKAIAYMKQQGIQHALNLYQQNPTHFIKMIS